MLLFLNKYSRIVQVKKMKKNFYKNNLIKTLENAGFIAFIVVSSGNTKMIYIDPPTNTSLDKAIDMVPGIIDKLKSGKKKEDVEAGIPEA